MSFLARESASGRRPRRRRRRGAARRLAGGLLLSAALHLLAFATLSFGQRSAPAATQPLTFRHVLLPPVVQVPLPPAAVERPRPPAVDRVEVEGPGKVAERVSGPPSRVLAPPPPQVQPVRLGDRPSVAQADVAPLMEAPEEFRRRLARSYPRHLQRRAVEGVVELRMFVSPRGRVSRVEVSESSGHGRLDQAAARMAEDIQFLPALLRDRPVGVWVSQRICFVLEDGSGDAPSAAECEQRVAARRR